MAAANKAMGLNLTSSRAAPANCRKSTDEPAPFLGGLTAAALGAAPKRPDILLILADDLGYGRRAATAAKPTKRRTSTASPPKACSSATPSRNPSAPPPGWQLMTGKYNFRNWQAFGIMDPQERTFGHLFREHGYRTAIACKWQFWKLQPARLRTRVARQRPAHRSAGFDEYAVWHACHTEDKGSRYGNPTIYSNGALRKNLTGQYGEDLFADFLLQFVKKPDPKPWFAYWPLALTHDPFVPTPDTPEFQGPNRLKPDNRFFKDMVE
jgi:arylsulfatase A-like enzyme